MRHLPFFFILGFLLFSVNLISQNTGIRGKVLDAETHETLIGVSVLVESSENGASTDLDGNFMIALKPGTYSLRLTYISYQTVLIEQIEVTDKNVIVLDDIYLNSAVTELGEVVITSEVLKNTEVALLTKRKLSSNFIDGISSAQFSRIGDSNASSAMSRVTGINVSDGKYVFVRGLGDRYTKTTMNGLDVPGLDPDRNTIQMNIFPTNLLDNIIVLKSFTVDNPADFTGGIVDINLKDFPERKTFNLSVGVGYNPSMHFNDNFIKSPASSTDFLGFDDGLRAIPIINDEAIPQTTDALRDINGPVGLRYREILNNFSPEMSGIRQRSMMNSSFDLSYGDQKNFKKFNIGYYAGLTYSDEVEYFQEAEFNIFGKPSNPDETELIPFEQQMGDFGVRDVLLGGLAGFAFKSDRSKISLNMLHLQNGESKAGEFIFENSDQGANFLAQQYNVEYSQRGLTNVLLQGRHINSSNDFNVQWKVSGTRSEIIDPDIRFLRFRIPDNNVGTEVGLPERIWRELMEDNLASRVDIEKSLTIFNIKSKLSGGIMYTYKERFFNIRNFQFQTGNTVFTGDPNEIFASENLFQPENINGVRYNPQFIPQNPNQFNSEINHLSSYLMADLNISKQLKANIGVRFEQFNQYYTGVNQTGDIQFDRTQVIDNINFFPAANLNYEISNNTFIRASYSQTIARPSFKEVSFAEILDPITGRTFVGGLFPETSDGGNTLLWDGNLQSTFINNADVRWEKFQEKGQLLSLSLFYKYFDSPIEIVQFLSDPGSFQPRNVGDAQVFGLELEMRKNLSFISPGLDPLMLLVNMTFTHSEIELSATELESRKNSARTGEKVSDSRSMAGQAPFIANVGFLYTEPISRWEASLFYNVQARTLEFVGFGNRTDIYSVPFHSLNLNLTKRFGGNNQYALGLKASNLLNDAREKVFSSFNASDKLFTRLLPQRTFSLSFSYSI